MTSRRLDLIRLDYAFAVLIPCLLPIFINNLKIIPHLDILIGFLFLSITGSTLNDALDRRNPREKETIERTKDFQWKELAALSIVSGCLGIFLFIRTITENLINAIFFALIIGFVIFYCLKKEIPILNQFLLATSHIIFPYLMIKADAGLLNSFPTVGEIFFLLALLIFGICGETVHEIIDSDAISSYSLKNQQKIVLITAVISIVCSLVAGLLLNEPVVYAVMVIPIGVIYAFRKPTKSSPGVKDIGIIMGNLVMLLLLVLIIQKNYQE
ncbi:hypothetical protein NEF87_003985 [Candidatus Lokiarchaeum ossiferum]|uniref:4-hydroxybenzoate polyprenyltransferase n=1 Tax=Candidatus Lokiarchaeum ossiferum TaxID=2951803 RepID=A0ABY6HW15_9ARCH|nr:hypothetical protein NEF87_003985 [Candidatus Lokiarchaeum sp. B-35]